MPVIVQDEIFDILPAPTVMELKRRAPKIKFEAAAGYEHQRERYSHARRSYGLRFLCNQAQLNTLDNWLDMTKSATFWWLPPEAVWKSPTAPTIRLMRITSEEIPYEVVLSGAAPNGPLYSVYFEMREV